MLAPQTNKLVKLVQGQLNEYFNLNVTVDGIAGPHTTSALLHIPTISSSWNPGRQLVAAVQFFATMAGINAGPIDGYWGPQTDYAYNELYSVIQNGRIDLWRDAQTSPEPAYNWPVENTQVLNDFFGPVGQNQTTVHVPYTIRLSWAPSITRNSFTCHELVATPIQYAMEEILDEYGIDGIIELKLDMWGGCLNVRKQRGGSKQSSHSWGIAIDWMTTQNQLRWGSDRAALARPEYDKFWQAWARQGAISYGHRKNYDWMHLQFTK